ncbi:MAG: hypothetical protein HKP58_20270 [Desulfatitalea sp.]|nr:hypothetical protein [Desulfatitalea sp.]NNK02754.1 hypothetical protein [Desulfatitalea sp.]
MRNIVNIFCLALGIIFIGGSHSQALEPQNAGAEDLVGKLNAIAEFVTSDNPLLQEIVQLIGGKPCPEQKDQPTCFDHDGYRPNVA